MPVIFDYNCMSCGSTFEAFTQNAEQFPNDCKLCHSPAYNLVRVISGPAVIEGTTPGSKPPPLKEAYNSPREMMQGHNDKKTHKRTIF